MRGGIGIQDADFVEIISRRGKVRVQARVTEEIASARAFCRFIGAGNDGFFKAANNLTVTARDPVSRQPELRHARCGCVKLPIFRLRIIDIPEL